MSRIAAARLSAFVLVAGVLAGVNAGPGAAAPPGSTSGAFAPIPIGADVLGAGGAGTVLERGAFAPFWNPANLALAPKNEVAVDYTNLFGLDLAHHTTVAVAWHRAPSRAVLGPDGGLHYIRSERQTGFGFQLGVTSVDFDPETYREVTPAFSFGTTLARGAALGLALRILSAASDFDGTSALGYSFDVGFTLDRYAPWSVAVATRNLLSSISWEDDSTDRLPAALTAGVAYRGLPGLTLATEATMSEDQSPVEVARFGAEWTPSFPIALRGGLAYRQDRGDDRYEPAFGAGTHLGGLFLDYARVGGSETLDASHRISLRFKF
ncbi:MAG TPA: hypothetical protein VNM87_10970 [Candidatus Udaeobacter sp.]|nr:hypothetical protein [Candidatus Udaeobacter sp.]